MVKQGEGLIATVTEELAANTLAESNLPDREKWDTALKKPQQTEESREERLLSLKLRQATSDSVEINVEKKNNVIKSASILFKQPGDYLIQLNKELQVGKSNEAVKIFEKDLVQVSVTKANAKLTLPFKEQLQSGEGSLVIFRFEKATSNSNKGSSSQSVGVDAQSAINFMWNRNGTLAVMSGDQDRGFKVSSFNPIRI